MQDERFEWDDIKAATNLTKHKIDFADARKVFDDPVFLDEFDLSMNYDEESWLAVGMAGGRLIVVTYTMRADRIRVISARKPTRKERQDYAAQTPHP